MNRIWRLNLNQMYDWNEFTKQWNILWEPGCDEVRIILLVILKSFWDSDLKRLSCVYEREWEQRSIWTSERISEMEISCFPCNKIFWEMAVFLYKWTNKVLCHSWERIWFSSKNWVNSMNLLPNEKNGKTVSQDIYLLWGANKRT